jgi:hypothetical protein
MTQSIGKIDYEAGSIALQSEPDMAGT